VKKEKLNLNLENYYSYNYLPMKVNLTNNFPMNSNEFCDSNNKFNSPHNDSLGNKNGFFAKNRVAFNMFNNCISNSNSKYNIYSSSINENLSTKSTSPINFDLKPNYEKLSYSNKNLRFYFRLVSSLLTLLTILQLLLFLYKLLGEKILLQFKFKYIGLLLTFPVKI